jgi:hypothetical protein
MLSRDIRIIDVDPRHWVNCLGLFRREKDKKAFLVLVVDNEKCLKALHSAKGPILGFEFPGVEHLEKIRREQAVDLVAVVPSDLVFRFFSAWQTALRRGDDWDRQIFTMIETAKTFTRRDITWHPAPPLRFPDINLDRIERILGRLWPDDTCLGFFAFEGKTPFTSLILGKKASKITLLTTLDTFGLADGPLDWRAQKGVVAALCKERFGPLHAALWIELASLRELAAGPLPLTYLHLAQKRGRAALWPRPLAWRILMLLARHFRGL